MKNATRRIAACLAVVFAALMGFDTSSALAAGSAGPEPVPNYCRGYDMNPPSRPVIDAKRQVLVWDVTITARCDLKLVVNLTGAAGWPANKDGQVLFGKVQAIFGATPSAQPYHLEAKLPPPDCFIQGDGLLGTNEFVVVGVVGGKRDCREQPPTTTTVPPTTTTVKPKPTTTTTAPTVLIPPVVIEHSTTTVKLVSTPTPPATMPMTGTKSATGSTKNDALWGFAGIGLGLLLLGASKRQRRRALARQS